MQLNIRWRDVVFQIRLSCGILRTKLPNHEIMKILANNLCIYTLFID